MDPGKYYHVYNHANGSEDLFRTDENYRYFLSRYAHYINPIAETYAYCLMPNHIHFLVQLKTEPELKTAWKERLVNTATNTETHQEPTDQGLERYISKQFANLFSSYTQAYNKVYRRRGSLFVPNFKRKEITSDSYFTSVVLYIHANPVKHGFVKHPSRWRWSSYETMLLDEPTTLKRKEVLQWFGNRTEYLKIHHGE